MENSIQKLIINTSTLHVWIKVLSRFITNNPLCHVCKKTYLFDGVALLLFQLEAIYCINDFLNSRRKTSML